MRGLDHKRRIGTPGFTLMELLTAMGVLVLLLTALLGMLNESQKAWGQARERLGQYRASQSTFETMSRRITDAVLNPYWGYEYPEDETSATPMAFSRQSELHFVAGPARQGEGATPWGGEVAAPGHALFFHGPFGVHNQPEWTDFSLLLNGWGYFVEFGDDSVERPAIFRGNGERERFRFRLMELRVPADELKTFEATEDPYAWFREAIEAGYARPVAENVVALIVAPLAPEGDLNHPSDIAPEYFYDTRAFASKGAGSYAERRSRHQLPPLLRLTMVVIDEPSAMRWEELFGEERPEFGMETLFRTAKAYDEDMEALNRELLEQSVGFRVFSTVIRLRNARWSATLEE